MILFSLFALSAVAAAAQPSAPSESLYFGLLHAHTHYSDGSGTPAEAFDMARAAGLDFFAVTEHNHSQAAGDDGVSLTPALYADLAAMAAQKTQDGAFVALFGQECSTISKGNHFNVFNASSVFNVANGDFKTTYEDWLPSHPEVAFIQFNHPDVRKDQRASTPAHKRNNDYGIDDYNGDWEALVEAADPYASLIEMIIGPAFSESTSKKHHDGRHEYDYRYYLNKGFHLGVSAGQDNHNKTWGVATEARVGVWADSLTKSDILAALRDRRTYATEDENLELRFSINDTPMGGHALPMPDGCVVIRISVQDTNEPDAEYRVRLFRDDAVGGDMAEVVEDQSGLGEGEIFFAELCSPGAYYFVRVTQSATPGVDDSRDDAWSSPIWIGSEFDVGDNSDHPEQLDEIHWEDAGDYVGLTRIVRGRVVRAFNSGRALFLNFDEDYWNTLGIYVADDDWESLGGAQALVERLMNKDVKIRGEIYTYRDRLQLRLQSLEQILEPQ